MSALARKRATGSAAHVGSVTRRVWVIDCPVGDPIERRRGS